MAKNIVICLDGTNNQLRGGVNTNVVRLFDLLDLSDPAVQVGYYDPGVGTFSSPAAWTPFARTLSRWAGLLFGAGLRQNLSEAYTFLMSTYQPGDRIYVFGFSRGAYTARALTGLLEVIGILRPGAENLVTYAVAEYTKQEKEKSPSDWKVLREYARIFGADLGLRHKDHAPVEFVGLWDTVKAAGTIGRTLRWPFTKQLPHATTVRHAISIDERRRAFKPYFVERTDPDHLIPTRQDRLEVWFAGVHSDVGGMFQKGARLSDIPLKWMAEEARDKGLVVRTRAMTAASRVTLGDATGSVHTMRWWWRLLGSRRRAIPIGAKVHASVEARIAANPSYAKGWPDSVTFVDPGWLTPRKAPPKRR